MATVQFTETELQNVNDLADIMVLVGIIQNRGEATSVQAAKDFLQCLGAAPTDHARALAVIEQWDVLQALGNWRPDGGADDDTAR